MLAPLWAAKPTARHRFLREARAAAAIRDEHVVVLYAVEESRGRPYLVMEHIDGRSLQDRLDRGAPLSLAEVIRIGRDVARGLAAAHAHGLIHRDIKPANILLDDRTAHAKITDFGLARAADDISITQDGIVLGTPQYMAPEQARGEPTDHTVDLFSLGCLLYTLCTGRAPFHGDGTLAILHSISHDVPAAPRETNPEIPEWLDQVIVRLLAKDAADRFQSAAQLAELLGEHLAHQKHSVLTARSRHLGAPKAAQRPSARRRRSLIGAAVLLLSIAGVGMTEVAGVTGLTATVVRLLTPDGTLVVAVDDPDVRMTVEGEGGVVITGIGPREVRLRPGSYRWIATKEGKVLQTELVTISRGGRQVISVRLEPPAAIGEIRRLEGHIENVYALAVSRDGARAVTGGWDQTVRIWDVAQGEELRCFNVREVTGRANHAIYCVALSSDRRLALAGGRDGTVWLWDVETGQELWRHSVPVNRTMGATSVAFSPEGRHALVGGGDGVARLWQISPWQEIRRLKHAHNEICWSVCFSPDGRQVLTAGGPDAGDTGAGLALWDLQTGIKIRRFKGHEQGLWCAVFSPDGSRVLSGSNDMTLRLWERNSATELRCFKGHTQGVRSVAFSPDGRRALSASMDQTIRLWDLETGQELRRFVDRESQGEIVCVAYVPPGLQALSGTFQGTIRLWQLPP